MNVVNIILQKFPWVYTAYLYTEKGIRFKIEFTNQTEAVEFCQVNFPSATLEEREPQ